MLADRDLMNILIKDYKCSLPEMYLYYKIREIYYFWGARLGCYASNDILAEEVGISVGTVKRCLGKLKEKNLIKICTSQKSGCLSDRNIYPLEDEVLRGDSERIRVDRQNLMESRNDVECNEDGETRIILTHNEVQNEPRTRIILDQNEVQNDPQTNKVTNRVKPTEEDICTTSTKTYVNSRIGGADAPVATSGNPHLNHQAVKDRWNAIAEKYKLQTINIVSPDRIASLKARIKDIGGEEAFWSTVERAIKNSAFLRGQNNRKWRATFNWILKPSKFIQMAEGAYSDSGSLLDDPKKPIQEAADDDWITEFFTFDKEA